MDFENQNNIIDNQTIISELTDDNDNDNGNLNIEIKLNEIKINLNNELNKLNLDSLKEKCKSFKIAGISKLKKNDLIQILELEFLKIFDILKEKNKNELKNICKNFGIKKINGTKKENLIYQILLYNSNNLIFKITDDTINNTNIDNVSEKITETQQNKTNLLQQLEKQKQEIELKMREELKKKEDEEKKQLEELKKKEDEEKKQLEELKKKEDEEKKELKKKKQSIPKNVRVIVWNHYIGEDIIKHKCLCCKKVTISNTNFEVGHVISEKNGGTHEINNLRPICFSCNHSMGTENMIEFVTKYGLYIG